MQKDGKVEQPSRWAFSLAEVLIVLIITGVVLSLIIPQLINDVDNEKWSSLRKRAVYNIREAARVVSIQNAGVGGFGSTMQFVNEFKKNLSIIKTCNTVSDCFPSEIKDITGASVNIDNQVTANGDTGARAPVGLVLNNGTSVHIIYNSACTPDDSVNGTFVQFHICANMVFDTNGFAKPNQVGKDIGFASIINPTNPAIAGSSPDVASIMYARWDAAKAACNAKGNDWHLPTRDELTSFYYNRIIIGNVDPGEYFWSSMEYSDTYAWFQYGNGAHNYQSKGKPYAVRCFHN